MRSTSHQRQAECFPRSLVIYHAEKLFPVPLRFLLNLGASPGRMAQSLVLVHKTVGVLPVVVEELENNMGHERTMRRKDCCCLAT